MKIRFVAAVTSAAILLLAACGGSESSTQDSTRTKNAALNQQIIPQNNIINNGDNQLNNNITNNDITNITNITNNNIINNGDNNIVNVPSNPTNKTCAQGGLCVIGDTGPGGGIVFYAEKSLQPWGQYMEVSKKTLDPNFDTMWCDVIPKDPFPNSDALGNGRATTEFYAKACKRGQLRIATDLVQGNYDDWHLPTLADAKQMYLVREQLGLEGQWHYTATPNLADGKQEAWAVYMVEQQIMSMNPEAGYAGRAIRTFAPKANPSCANGDACKVGDVGPGGGIVFYAAATPQPWGQYMEVSTKTLDPRFDTMWCDVAPTEPFPNADALGNGRAVTEFYAKPCTRGQLRIATDLAQGGYDDWHLPTLADLKQLYLVSKQLKIEGQWHYSATPDLNTKQAIAQYMVDGTVKSMNPLAGFAGRATRTFGPKATAPIVVAGAPTTFPAPSLPPPTQAPMTMSTIKIPSTATTKTTFVPQIITPSTLPPTTAPAVTAPVITLPPKSTTPTTLLPKPTIPNAAPVTTPVTAVQVPTTAPIVKSTSCATGGACKVGDTGPGGGIVFYAATAPQPWGQYLEVSTKTLDPRFDTMWCDGQVTSRVPNDDAIGNGRLASETYANKCTKGALRLAVDLVQNGFDDWHLPTLKDAAELYAQRNVTKIDVQWHYTTTAWFKTSGTNPFAVYMGSGEYKAMNPLAGYAVRAVRTFGPKQVCATGGACKVGDTGPGGGIVFYAATAPQPWGQYLEVSTKTLDPRFDTMWCDVAPTVAFPNAEALGNGRAVTEFYAKACKRGQLRIATDLVQGGYDDWHLPTLADLKQLYLVSKQFKIEGQWHYSATPAIAGRMANALYMVDGTVKSVNPLAGYAGRAIRTFGQKTSAAPTLSTPTTIKK